MGTDPECETHLRVGITELDGDVSFQFVLESDGLDTRDGFDDLREDEGISEAKGWRKSQNR
jgi:hypothetical protein